MRKSKMEARPTLYRGTQMRSRLEAGFAEWVDSMLPNGNGWTYEPMAFAGRSGQYLPDFELHGAHYFSSIDNKARPFAGRVFVEVKPRLSDVSDAEAERWLRVLTEACGAEEDVDDPVLLLCAPDGTEQLSWLWYPEQMLCREAVEWRWGSGPEGVVVLGVQWRNAPWQGEWWRGQG